MPSKVTIEDITTLKDLSKSSLESYRVISNKDPVSSSNANHTPQFQHALQLDRLEFSIGLERGEISTYSDSPLLKIKG